MKIYLKFFVAKIIMNADMQGRNRLLIAPFFDCYMFFLADCMLQTALTRLFVSERKQIALMAKQTKFALPPS